MAPAPVAQKRFYKTLFIISLVTCSVFVACIVAINMVDYEAANMFLIFYSIILLSMTVLFPGYIIISVPNLHQAAIKKLTPIMRLFPMVQLPESTVSETINLPEREICLEPRSAYTHDIVPTISARISNYDNQDLGQSRSIGNNDTKIIYVKEYMGRKANVKPQEPQERASASKTPTDKSSHANSQEKKRLGFRKLRTEQTISVSELRKTCDEVPSFTDISKIPSQDSESELSLNIDPGTFWN